jgi:hypothetical protein
VLGVDRQNIQKEMERQIQLDMVKDFFGLVSSMKSAQIPYLNL